MPKPHFVVDHAGNMRQARRPMLGPMSGPMSGGTKAFVGDGFTNLAADLGYGANNLASAGGYAFNPITRNRIMLGWMYRSAWLVRQVVDAVADDMIRAGIEILGEMPPERQEKLFQYFHHLGIWHKLNETIKWSRLYGGAIAVLMIDGQKLEQPLRLDSIGRDQFKGLLVLDRWMVDASQEDLVTDFGVDFGLPKYYRVVADARGIPNMRIHHSRCLRFEGAALPYWDKQTENEWGLSVVEPMWDRIQAFDSATQGAAQLVYKAYLRTYKVPKLRELIAAGGAPYRALLRSINLIRTMQCNEGMTVVDAEDDIEVQQYTFAGLTDVLIQFGQQISGSCQIPMTRLFGQSPVGMNATGDSDLRNYYDSIKAQQEARLRRPMHLLCDIAYRSRFGSRLPAGFNFNFHPLWQMTDLERAQIGMTVTQAVDMGMQAQVPVAVALRELKQWSRVTGLWTNITDEDIEQAELAALNPPDPNSPEGEAQPGEDKTQGAEGGAPQGADNQQLDRQTVAGHYFTDRPTRLVQVHGLNVVIETPKGERREGYGWAQAMPADYGYISGTSSGEGPQDQMDCYIGDDAASTDVWVIEQVEPQSGEFDEHKVMLLFSSQAAAVDCYVAAFSDASGMDRIGAIKQYSLAAFKQWLHAWRYGSALVPAA